MLKKGLQNHSFTMGMLPLTSNAPIRVRFGLGCISCMCE